MRPSSIIFICLSSLLFYWNCDRGPGLTPATQEGKNTFSCKIDGEVWVPDGRSDLVVTVKPLYGGFYERSGGSAKIWIRANSSSHEEIQLYLTTTEKGVHLLNKNTDPFITTLSPENFGSYRVYNAFYVTSTSHTGMVNITRCDTINNIISGTFEFTVSKTNGETFQITEGRFDIKSPL